MAKRGDVGRAQVRAARSIAWAISLWMAAVVAVGCSSPRDDTSAPADASTSPDGSVPRPPERDESARAAADRVRTAFVGNPALAERFAPTTEGFRTSTDGVTSPGWRSAWTERANHVGARLPAAADRPFEAGVGVSDLYRLKLAHVGATSAPLAVDQGRGVYRDAFPSTDLAFAASPERLEWAYTLKDEKAPSSFKLHVTLPKHLTTVRDGALGGLEFLDEQGDALLRIPRASAVDAAGKTRDAALTWDGAVLTVSVETEGLAYPIVIDPAVETVVWQAREQLMDSHRWAAAAFDSTRSRTVLFGGYVFGYLNQETWEWDGVAWSLRATSGPSARSNPAMAFDSARGMTVLFGGSNGSPLNDTWEWDGTSWYKRCQTACTAPPVRIAPAMAFDALAGKTVLFGGHNNIVTLSDTYTWDGTTWAAVAASGPVARQRHMMTYDTTNKRVLMFGGQTGINDITGVWLNDLWKYSAGVWTQIAYTTSDGSTLPTRSSATFVWEGAVGKALIAGGRTPGTDPIPDTWELSGTVWTKISAVDLKQSDAAAAYDSARSRVVVVQGTTFEFNSATGTWTTLTDGISGRLFSASAYDANRNRVILFGGFSNTPLNDTWEWTGYNWTQVCTSAACIASRPVGRWGTVGAFDSAVGNFVVFGGLNGGTTYDETWGYDGNVWSQKCTACVTNSTKPSARTGAAGAFDASRLRTVIFGGATGNTANQETWEWNGASWGRVCSVAPCASTLPAARQYASMVYDSTRRVLMLYGGQDAKAPGTLLGDTWEYNGAIPSWTLRQATPPGALAGRIGATLAYDPLRKKVVLLGGTKTSTNGGVYQGAESDTWEWDNTAATWVLGAAATSPGLRWGEVMQYDPNRRRVVAALGATGSGGKRDTWEYYSRGGACALDAECATGFCVDGVCCEQVSCGSCQACNLTGSAGQCAPVVNADDPDSCPAALKTCDAAGVCKSKQAVSCSLGSTCASGFCADGYCCDQACSGGCDVCNVTPGTCTVLAKGAIGAAPTCGAYFCDGAAGACPLSCAADTDCASGFFCASGGVCQARRAAGGSCNVASGGDCAVAGCRECGGTLGCKDGFCCSSACTGSCQTCAATPGTCTSVTSGDDLDTCTGTSTCGASGSCLAKAGQACTLASQCASGFCADNVCCNTACNGSCDVCNATPGTCTAAAQGSAGAPACVGYVCNGSNASCPTACGNDADCASGYYCGAGGTCVVRKVQGATCNQAAGSDCKSSGCRVCASGNCIDGFCCDTACGGACDACNGAALGWSGATNGTCKVAPVSYAGSPACVTYACDGASPSCATGCTSDLQCATGFYCGASGTCVAQKTQGLACNLAVDCKTTGTCRECSTGNCVDGYCCNTACGGQCQACDVAGALGSCLPVTGAVHSNPSGPARSACGGSGTCGARCDGVDVTQCHNPGSGTACGVASCSAATGSQTNVGSCSGGACSQGNTPCYGYACGATTCKSSCGSDADCANASYYCTTGGACVLKEPDGNACGTNNGACLHGNCVGGICCDTACTGAGFSCNLPTSRGRCVKANATACTSSSECGSGFCVDGVCCDSACTDKCQACDATGLVGTCSPVTGAPHGAVRGACSGTGVGTACGPTCNGTDTKACNYPTGATKCGADTCTDGGTFSTVTHLGTCNGSGSCNASSGDCGTYKCTSATACKSACTTSLECQSGNYCKAGFCVPMEGLGVPCVDGSACPSGFCVNKVCCGSATCDTGASCNATPTTAGRCAKLQGVACSANAECASSHCVDGFCCDTTCTGKCEACGVSGKEGTCVPIVGQPKPGHAACSTTSGDATCGLSCNGTDASDCHNAPTTTSCGAPACAGGTETDVTTCDGGGRCPLVQRACGSYECGTTTCKSSCAADGDCVTGSFCKAGACVAVQLAGEACTVGTQCKSGFCTDGVCCGVASCGAGAACAGLGASAGTCLKGNGVACTASAECAAGHCVDGVCCDKGCDGQCEACDVKGSEGTCTPVTGTPHLPRAVCDTLDVNDCAKKSCDGSIARDKCVGWANGTTTSCGVDACTVDKKLQKHGACDGHGVCALPEATSCVKYACDATAKGCKSSCTSDADCGDSFKCDVASSTCVEGATCSADRTQSTDKTGATLSCAPYLCGTDGSCLKSCATSDDCVSGTSCDSTTHACIGITETQSSGGCSVGEAGGAGGTTAIGAGAAVGLLALVRARRRGAAKRAA
jgi:hypothetical protein